MKLYFPNEEIIQWTIYPSSDPLSLLTAITNKGDWFISNLVKHNNSEVFMLFVQKLMIWLWDDLNIQKSRIILMMDNSPIHPSWKWKRFLNSLGWRILFLSPYTSEYAPIKLMFNVLKQNISTHCKDLLINLKRSEGLKQVKDCMVAISKYTIVSFDTCNATCEDNHLIIH